MSDTFVVWTECGYYFTTGNGRYGRTYGRKDIAESLCQKHSAEIVGMLVSAGLDAKTEQIATRGCMVCQRKRKKGIR